VPRSRRINTGVPLSPIAFPHDTPRRGEPVDERHVHPLPQRALHSSPRGRRRAVHRHPRGETASATRGVTAPVETPVLRRRALHVSAGAGRIDAICRHIADCLGTDYPFGALGTAERTARELEDLNLGARLVEAIGRGNALGLFPRQR
jgi:hypothetical protein